MLAMVILSVMCQHLLTMPFPNSFLVRAIFSFMSQVPTYMAPCKTNAIYNVVNHISNI